MSLPYVVDNGNSTYLAYEPKSARLQQSPYLQPVFPPHNPFFGMDRPVTSRSPRASRTGVLQTTGRNQAKVERLSLSVPFKNTPYKPPNVEQTYSERKAMYDQRAKDYDRKNSKRYQKRYPADAYKTSMYGQYEQHVLHRQVERLLTEEDEYRCISQSSQRRREQLFEEASKLHEEQMKKSGVQEPQYNF